MKKDAQALQQFAAKKRDYALLIVAEPIPYNPSSGTPPTRWFLSKPEMASAFTAGNPRYRQAHGVVMSKSIDNSKTEEIAVNAVRARFMRCPFIQTNFATNDKVILDDGTIDLYDSAQFSVATCRAKIPVQIKGTCTKVKTHRDGHVKFHLAKKYLEKYESVNGGILFFYVTVDSKSLAPMEVYYEKLLRYDIERYLEEFRMGKGVTIRLRPFPNDPSDVDRVVRQFSDDRDAQKSTEALLCGFLNKDGELPSDIKTFKLKRRLLGNESITSLSAFRDAPYVYAEAEHGREFVIDRWDNLEKIMIGREVEVSSGDFVMTTMLMIGEDDRGECVEFEGFHIPLVGGLDTTNSSISDGDESTDATQLIDGPEVAAAREAKISYRLPDGIRSRYKTLAFASEFMRTGEVFVNGRSLLKARLNGVSGEDIDRVAMLRSDYHRATLALEKMGIEHDLDMSTWSEDDNRIFCRLADAIVDGMPMTGIKSDYPIGYYTVGDIRIYIVQDKRPDGNSLLSSIYSDRIFFAFGEEQRLSNGPDDRVFPVPTLMALNRDDYQNMANLNPFELDACFDRMPITEGNEECLNNKLLEMLSAYDEGSKAPDPLLACCAVLAKRLCQFRPASTLYRLNLLQTMKRRRDLTEEEQDLLREIAIGGSEPNIMAAAYALLGETKLAAKCLEKCNEQQVLSLTRWPIGKFFQEIKLSE